MKKVSIFPLSPLLYISLPAQEPGHEISVKFEGYQDSIVYLGCYFGDKLSIADTSKTHKGEFIFEGPGPLKQGVYFLVSIYKQKLFEFLIGDDQHFKIEADLHGLPDGVQFKGSDENDRFYSYLDYNKENYDRIKQIQAKLKSLPPGHDSIALLTAETDRINQESIDYKLKIIETYPHSISSVLFNIMREPEVPDFFLDNGRQDSISAYLYYRNHYWEYVDFADDRFLRTPVFHRKLERYMRDVIPRHPDSIINEIDVMIEKTLDNSEMQNYLLWYFTNTYETSKVMGYDKIFVHMVDQYFTQQSYDWLHPTVQQNMIIRVNQLRNVLLGAYAPALVMADTGNQFISLRELSAEYIIILFWSSTCGECKQEVKTLNEFYKDTDIDIKIFAVNTDTTFSKWKDYISKHQLDWVHVNGNVSLTGDYHNIYDIYSTPVIYVLDSQKAIIAKRLTAEKIPAIIERHKKGKTY